VADSPAGRAARVGRRFEDFLTGGALLLMAALPVLEMLSRRILGAGIPGCSGYVQNLTLWVAFLGALVVTRERRHLNLAAGPQLLPARLRPAAQVFTSVVSVAVLSGLAWGSWGLFQAERESLTRLGGWLPTWAVLAILPAAFAVMLIRFVWQAGGGRARAVAALGIGIAWAIGHPLAAHVSALLWPGIVAVLLAALLGAPIFVVLGGVALLLLFNGGDPVSAIPQETARIVGSPEIPMVPLYTLAGYVLAEGGASRRLMRLFQALVGWMPGGLPVATTLACAFFTAFTGASGVTILALGGVMLPVLLQTGYRERFSIGLLTSTGSLGLLFPPSLPVILYGVAAQIAIPDLFKAGIVPGLMLVTAVCALGLREGLVARAPRPPFRLREAGAGLWGAKWEMLLPLPTAMSIFGGMWTFTEAAAITAVYALVVETVIHRELHLARDLPRVLVQCVTLVGGVLIILGVSMGLTNYLIMADVPAQAAE
jgi:tripartite ATP-independent transporter DctM subunit